MRITLKSRMLSVVAAAVTLSNPVSALAAGAAEASTYPSHPIRFVVPAAPGGADRHARAPFRRTHDSRIQAAGRRG